MACARKDYVCKNDSVVTFCNPTKEGMDLYFVCGKCQFYWKKIDLDEHDLQMTAEELSKEGEIKALEDKE